MTMHDQNDSANKHEFSSSETTKTVIEYGRHGKLQNRNEKNLTFKHQMLHTACICISIFTLGWRSALIGPTLPDLRIIIDENLATASWIFTAKSLGGLLGAICGGFAYDRFNKIGVFVATIIVMGVSAALTPWCYHLAAMLVVHGFYGVCASSLETAATADMALVWKQKAGPYMQAVQFAFSAGAIVSPLVAEPFLADLNSFPANFEPLVSNTSYLATPYLKPTGNVKAVTESQSEQINGNTSVTEYAETFIYIPYGATSLLCLLSVGFYAVIYCVYGSVYNTLNDVSDCEISSHRNRYFLSKRMKYTFTILLASAMLLYIVSENCFIGFLMTFLVSERKWSKAMGSVASSVFWITFSVGRLVGIVVIKFLSMSSMIFIFSVIYTSGSVLFLLAVIFDQIILEWVSIGVIGFGMSVLFSLVFSWLSKNVCTLTGKMASIFFIFMSFGKMGVPILVGYLMEKVSQMWFIYSNIFLSFSMFATFVFAIVSFNLMKRVHKRSEKANIMLKDEGGN
ncbi:sodium-dependent glucose transporter 1-like [Ruditapes philippinarum]|uniref:sodium-dependent glucose transporter 1-like n=1 Tax=Ruditapes philippinarum TaxID=129788 RepID=UPI00295BFFB6|nr:sodium-dependent glucose transporter 1-like [Ruditapes philippinarum]